jgi:PAS domain S-box-containing protein
MVDLIASLKELDNPVLYETGANKEFISSNIFELTGYYSEEMKMNRDLFPGLINPEDYIETNFRIKNWHKNNEPGVLTLQFRFQSSNGSQFWIEDHLIGLNKNGVKYMRGLMMNISEHKSKETQLLQLRTEWREKEMFDEKEREIVYQDIQRQLDELTERAKQRRKKVEVILVMAKEKDISFEQLGY